MSKVAIITDSNSGISQDEGKKLGIKVLPMPFTIDGKTYYEDINLTQDEFYEKLMNGAEVFTSQPLVGDVSKLWDEVLQEYDEIVHIPMSSGLSGSCQTAIMLANEYDGKVQVVDSQRISVTQKWDVLDAIEMAKNGMGVKSIADTLTDEGIPSPSVYKGKNYKNPSVTYGMWQNTTIRDILRNPTYIGNLAQGKQYKVSYKMKCRRRNAQEDWIVVENACPAIIDKETFEIVQSMADKNRNNYGKELPYLFRGFCYCKECGHRMGIDRSKYTKADGEQVEKAYCICSLYKKYSKRGLCTNHKINYFELEEAILKDVKKQCKQFVKTSNLEELLKQNDKTLKIKEEMENRLNKITKQIDLQDTYIDKVYKDKVKGIIDEEMFLRQYNLLTQEKTKLKNDKHELELNLYQLENKINSKENEQYINVINEFLKLKKPSRELLSALIDKITIDNDQNIEITYNFKPII